MYFPHLRGTFSTKSAPGGAHFAESCPAGALYIVKSVPGGAHFAERCPYRGTVPSEKEGHISRRVAYTGALDLVKSVPAEVCFVGQILQAHRNSSSLGNF